jgi:hypothetical protein
LKSEAKNRCYQRSDETKNETGGEGHEPAGIPFEVTEHRFEVPTERF